MVLSLVEQGKESIKSGGRIILRVRDSSLSIGFGGFGDAGGLIYFVCTNRGL
ncbi:MAG: hypothetical protein U9N82_01575 [Thermodesulfobacteriota bacterium]|nr:hypothetical protein [Thermodesulfobacteriota bacterium]